MPFLADARPRLRHAFDHHYAIPSFNVCSLEMAVSCVQAAEFERAPVMLQTYPGDLEQGSPTVMAGMVRALGELASVPVMLHLDHGDTFERAISCLRAGYSSVMFDGEALSLDDNVRATRQLAAAVHAAGAALEAAAGSFGGGEGAGDEVHLTEPEVAARLLREGHADMVACSVGSRHGQPSRIDLGRLREIAAVARGPLVFHGGSGIPAEDIADAVRFGVVKVNIGMALARALRGAWGAEAVAAPDHYTVYARARSAMVDVAREKLRITGAAGRAG